MSTYHIFAQSRNRIRATTIGRQRWCTGVPFAPVTLSARAFGLKLLRIRVTLQDLSELRWGRELRATMIDKQKGSYSYISKP